MRRKQKVPWRTRGRKLSPPVDYEHRSTEHEQVQEYEYKW